MTKAEWAFWLHVRGNAFHGFRFRRQQLIRGYIADFYCPEARLVVEIDGMSHRHRVAYDRFRDEVMTRAGLRVLRLLNREVLFDIERALQRVRAALAESRKEPSPPRDSGETPST